MAKARRSPEDQRRNLIIIVSIVVLVVGFVLAIALVAMTPKQPTRVGSLPTRTTGAPIQSISVPSGR